MKTDETRTIEILANNPALTKCLFSESGVSRRAAQKLLAELLDCTTAEELTELSKEWEIEVRTTEQDRVIKELFGEDE